LKKLQVKTRNHFLKNGAEPKSHRSRNKYKFKFMKKLLLFALLFQSYFCLSQTLNAPTIPANGMEFTVKTMTTAVSNAQTNGAWNFSTAVTTTASNFSLLPIATSSQASSYPLATHVRKIGTNDEAYVAYNGTNYRFCGSMGMIYTTPLLMHTWPISAGYTHTNTVTLAFQGPGIMIDRTDKIDVQYIASGSLTMPGGVVYPNAVLLKVLRTQTDLPRNGQPTTYVTTLDMYHWWIPGYPVPIAETRIQTPPPGQGSVTSSSTFRTPLVPLSTYPTGTVHCDPANITAIVDVTNPATGKTWMDRNLGASQVATSSTDALAYGDCYQWGRRADGHQCRTSPTTTTMSAVDQPAHGEFILIVGNPNAAPADWRSPQNDNLWQGVNGINNPCPSGYRLPTAVEHANEVASWSSQTSQGAFNSVLKLTLGGGRNHANGNIDYPGNAGPYWNSTVSGTNSSITVINNVQNIVFTSTNYRMKGNAVRCIKESSLSSTTFNTIGLKLYPNPVVSILNVSIDSNLINQPYTIIDGLGKVVLKGKLNGVESTINVEQLSKGIYYLKIDGNSSSKFIKQ